MFRAAAVAHAAATAPHSRLREFAIHIYAADRRPLRDPEQAVHADGSVPSRYARVIAVDYSPDGRHAIGCLEYNEPPAVEPYVVLCENTPNGWVEGQGVSGGGVSWMATSVDAANGVEVAWGRPPTVRWDIPTPAEPYPPPSAGRW